MIYLVGQPGSGKSTLMLRLTAEFQRVPVEAPVPHDMLICPIRGTVVGAEIGRRRETFSGTDALSSSIIEKADPWVRTLPYPLMLGEGARLGNARFLNAASEVYEVILALVDHDDAETWRAARSAELGKAQNESWVRGRRSSSRNLATNLVGARVLKGHPNELYPQLAALMEPYRQAA